VLQVHASPQISRTANPAKKKQPKNVPSTNVSSPVREPKQKIRQYTYTGDEKEDEDYYDKPRHPTRNQKARGRAQETMDNDDSDSASGFAPVRQAKLARKTTLKGLGNPISTDERTAKLDDWQSDVLKDFMEGAKRMRRTIMVSKGHREAIFSDTVLREMGLQLPATVKEMSAIKGIKPEMVERYGKQFLPLIENTRTCYGTNLPESSNTTLQRLHTEVEDNDEERPMDKNHQIVIDLCNSEDEATAKPTEDESDYSFDDNEDDEDDGFHTSHHFTQHMDPEVEAFNNRMTQVQGFSGGASTSKTQKKPKQSRSSGPQNKPKYSGVKKRNSYGSKRPKGGNRKSGGNGGRNALSSILAMPT
jgi:bloom syndrome protein